jgi:hypothetical protein
MKRRTHAFTTRKRRAPPRGRVRRGLYCPFVSVKSPYSPCCSSSCHPFPYTHTHTHTHTHTYIHTTFRSSSCASYDMHISSSSYHACMYPPPHKTRRRLSLACSRVIEEDGSASVHAVKHGLLRRRIHACVRRVGFRARRQTWPVERSLVRRRIHACVI